MTIAVCGSCGLISAAASMPLPGMWMSSRATSGSCSTASPTASSAVAPSPQTSQPPASSAARIAARMRVVVGHHDADPLARVAHQGHLTTRGPAARPSEVDVALAGQSSGAVPHAGQPVAAFSPRRHVEAGPSSRTTRRLPAGVPRASRGRSPRPRAEALPTASRTMRTRACRWCGRPDAASSRNDSASYRSASSRPSAQGVAQRLPGGPAERIDRGPASSRARSQALRIMHGGAALLRRDSTCRRPDAAELLDHPVVQLASEPAPVLQDRDVGLRRPSSAGSRGSRPPAAAA